MDTDTHPLLDPMPVDIPLPTLLPFSAVLHPKQDTSNFTTIDIDTALPLSSLGQDFLARVQLPNLQELTELYCPEDEEVFVVLVKATEWDQNMEGNSVGQNIYDIVSNLYMSHFYLVDPMQRAVGLQYFRETLFTEVNKAVKAESWCTFFDIEPWNIYSSEGLRAAFVIAALEFCCQGGELSVLISGKIYYALTLK